MSPNPPRLQRVALVGNPNCGKTALFNRLTGSRQKVANYAGVTVERKSGLHQLQGANGALEIIDLPGAYTLEAASPDEAVTRDVCLGRFPGETAPDVIVCVLDAINLQLHLRFALEVLQLGRPMVLAVNRMDVAERHGLKIDLESLSSQLGVPVVGTVAVRRQGADALTAQLAKTPVPPTPRFTDPARWHEEAEALYDNAVSGDNQDTLTDAADRLLLHPATGLPLLAILMFVMFQAVFAWADPLIGGVESGIGMLGEVVAGAVPEGLLNSLLVDGIIAGVGGVVVFLPQILILFLFILLLEESGYLPRAAFLLDRLMVGAGLSGRAFIPLLSSFACAVPGIMATRSIPNPRDRLATIMVAPLMTCSARLPVYTLLIAAFIPQQSVGGVFNLQGLVLFVLYALGIVSAVAVSWIMKRWGGAREEQPLLLELPAYRMPHPRDILIGLWERALIFLRRVGGIILALTILLWALSSFPAPPADAVAADITYSWAGQLGRLMEPLFAPVGFNWQICIALVPAMAAREVAVSALATVYALSATDDEAASLLTPLIAQDWSLATALSLLVWFIYAPQCISTLAVIRRETNQWRMVAISAGYLFGLAYGMSLLTYQLARGLGL
jgi:ferrous iron transport protein B